MTGLLFEIPAPDAPDIPGLQYLPDSITAVEEQTLIEIIDQQPWLNDLKRRVQHYGYKYDYKARAVTNDAYLGSLPDWLMPVVQKLSFEPDQAIVNEYLPGQGISAHVDCVPCFSDTIASLSLGSGAVMQFTNGQEKYDLYLKPRSLIILSGPARYKWTHAIPARKSDVVDGFKIERERRVLPDLPNSYLRCSILLLIAYKRQDRALKRFSKMVNTEALPIQYVQILHILGIAPSKMQKEKGRNAERLEISI